ncbi:MAG: tetratricopeptide repeat protein [Terriglobia bacterium]
MEPERSCPRCGRIIPWGCEDCPTCSEHRGYFWWVRRDAFLAMVMGFLIVLLFLTGFVVRRFHALERRLAQTWYDQGEQALKAGHSREALSDFRNALAYSRENSLYQLRLAQALEATARTEEARIYLLSLRDREPGNGPVNLELARLAVGGHAFPEAVQYFHDAVYSEWSGDPVVQRRAVRLELVKFLLASDQKAEARAELIAIASNLPADAELQTQVGQLLMRAGGYDDALRVFRQALALKPHSAPALAGAGECYFQSGQYTRAEVYLDQALRQDPNLKQAGAMRDTARVVLDMDPFARWLGEQERERRARRAFDQALTRLEACTAQRGINLQAPLSNPLQELYARAMAFQPSVRQRTHGGDSEWVSRSMDLVFEIEKAVSQACGAPHGPDQALLLIARAQEGPRP